MQNEKADLHIARVLTFSGNLQHQEGKGFLAKVLLPSER
jgi:hypothetical protein